MSKFNQLKALMRKNLLVMKTNWGTTICEILFPMILMVFMVLIRKAISIEEYQLEISDEKYLETNSTTLLTIPDSAATGFTGTWNGMSHSHPLQLCLYKQTIAAVGDDENISKIKKKMSDTISILPAEVKAFVSIDLKFKDFKTVDELNEYISSDLYKTDESNPELCFGFFFQKKDNNDYEYSLHYFDPIQTSGEAEIPPALEKAFDVFQKVPDTKSYRQWLYSGYLASMHMINEVILEIKTGDPNAQINYGVAAQKYDKYIVDDFGLFIGFMLPFFLIIAYTSPLCIMVFRMVKEKETKAKEGMKIMGLDEGVYFLSFFLHWLILNTLYSLINSLILTLVLENTGYIFIFAFFWLFGMSVFSMAYFFQALIDKTRIAVVMAILIYYIMFFVSVAVASDEVSNVAKMFMSLLPPTALPLGIGVIAKFESTRNTFDSSSVSFSHNNYSVGDMYLMLGIDFLIYLFVGYYLQNVVSHQFGIKRPFYFLCTKSFWCKSKKVKSSQLDESQIKERLNSQKENFQSEQSYEAKMKSGKCLKIQNLKKVFDDGKTAVDGLNLNLYNEEIFALLGHNGAGKSTTISILCGLYEATSGVALYSNENVLDDTGMENFRKKLGICPQHDVLFGDLSVKDHLRMFAVFKGVPSDKIEGDVEQIVKDMHLEDKAQSLAGKLSGGQKRKLSIAIALIGGSEVVFLDEPSSGMDITSRRNLWEILKKCVGKRIIVLTTHYMEEASVLGKRIGIVSNGKLKCCGSGLFLINQFGKYINLNVYKQPNAADDLIIKYVSEKIPNVEHEILSEEILFRIPKTTNVNGEEQNFLLKEFFVDLDKCLESLGIKSYGASMPTLEDVFLNVSADSNKKLANIDSENNKDVVKIENEIFQDGQERSQGCGKFTTDLTSSIKKRMLQIIRDKKSFMLEILSPIILVLIGLGVSAVEFTRDSPTFKMNLNLMPQPQEIYINSNFYVGGAVPRNFYNYDGKVNYNYLDIPAENSVKDTLVKFNNEIFKKTPDNKSYASYYLIDFDKTQHKYSFVEFVNLEARFGPPLYAQEMLTNLLKEATGEDINVSFYNRPFPLTLEMERRGETRNNSNLVFFVSIAFALIPANFITIIIKERETNTKHLQIISGISLTSYWMSNYIFEFIKYFFIGGVNLAIIALFDKFPDYLWLIYLLYGPSMISFTYMTSFFFTTESTAQNFVILVNFIFGGLGGTIILILRILEDLIEIGKVLAFVLRVIPSFAFAYGFNQLLSIELLYFTDWPKSFFIKLNQLSPMDLEYAGMDVLFLGIEAVLYLVILIILETTFRSCGRTKAKSHQNANELKSLDSFVAREIERANNYVDEANDSNNKKYSVRVKNLEKYYKKAGMCSDTFRAVNKLSFCLEYGECFALLGVNGAGKTTTFKCLTSDILPSGGEIYIDGKEISTNFNDIRNKIGYCPQFDAIFEYMTVKENLEFYAKIKGLPQDKREKIIDGLMTELNLKQYTDKESGNLSGGNKRKLSVGIAMIGNPPIMLLDEPSNGMDPEARRFMWAIIHKISTQRKQSSVILTTHSMEEAETLCRRMGIMVGGQFKCLGTSQGIKDKYGTGYEVDLRISLLNEEGYLDRLNGSGFNGDNTIDMNNVNQLLENLGKGKFAQELTDGRFGKEIVYQIKNNGSVSVKTVIEWTFYLENCLRFTSKILNFYNEVTIAEFYENNYQFKINRDQGDKYSIGFLFGFIEDQKSICNLSEYSISQTSLEQIFNKFARENNEKVLGNEKSNIDLNKESLAALIDQN